MKKENIFVGIDYSMSSPGVCIGTKNKYELFGKKSLKKHKYSYIGDLVNLTLSDEMIDFTTTESRFDSISGWVMDILSNYKNIVLISLEGYAMGARGQVFNIGENTGLLKYKLWMENYDFIIPSPNEIKKFATGKGNAKKTQMGEAFLNQTGFDLPVNMESTWERSPVADMVDAYWMYRWSISCHENNLNRLLSGNA